jgi:DNA repair protein RecN (Recombination protein N)
MEKNMLLELKIRNLAIIESADIVFGQGLNVLTGETGAGKSILLDALSLALGGRCERAIVRTGNDEGWVEAVFEVKQDMLAKLEEWGIVIADNDPLILKRVVQVTGRSKGYVNCTMVPVNVLKQIAGMLLDFGRQHEQSILLNPEKHLELLDQYAGLEQERIALSALHSEVMAMIREESELSSQSQSHEEKIEFLKFQRDAIISVDPQEGEEEELEQKLESLEQEEKCYNLAQKIEQELKHREHPIRDMLASVVGILENLAKMDDSVEHVLEDLQNALIAVEETASSMQMYQKKTGLDKEKKKEIEKRLDQVIQLQQKFGGTFAGVKKRLEEIGKEILAIQQKRKRWKDLAGLISKAKAQLYSKALELDKKRKKAAQVLCPHVEKELTGLAIPNAKFQVSFTPVKNESDCIAVGENEANVAPHGLETAHFLFSANQGENLFALEKVASGGEISRIMLALKSVMVNAFPVDTFVVDEIDSGVAGAAAITVAQKLKEIVGPGKGTSQIISISHTPQIAASADQHFYVEKITKQGRTIAQVHLAQGEKKIMEIARMLAGDYSLEKALELAKELLEKKCF